MDGLSPELLLCIAEFLKPRNSLSSTENGFHKADGVLDRDDDILNLMKVCRGFYKVLLHFYYRTLIQQNGLDECLVLAVRMSSARPMEELINIVGDKFSWSDHTMYKWLETCFKTGGGYEPFNWLLTEQKRMQMNSIKFKNSQLLYSALRSRSEPLLLRLFDEADQEDLHTRDQTTHNTLLATAVRKHQSKAIIRYLLQRGIRISQRSRGKTALDIAIQVVGLDAIEVFLEYDGQTVEQLLWKTSGYTSALRNMFKSQHSRLGSDPDHGSEEDNFRLAVMIFDNAPDEILDDNRSLKTIWGSGALMRAIECQCWGIAQRLIQHGMGIDFAAPYNSSLITDVIHRTQHCVSAHEAVATINMLLDKGVPINFEPINGSTLLHQAGSALVVEFLIDHGFDVNVENASGNTPLHEAVLRGQLGILCALISRGADINCCNNAGHETPLMQAVCRGNAYCIDLLLEYGARTDIADADGMTPLAIALEDNFTYAVALITRYS